MCVCVCVGSKTEKERDGEREKVQADVCIHSVGGSRLFAEDGETREGKEKKKERDRDREARIK